MSIKNAYLNGIYEDLAARYAEQSEFLEAVHEVLETLVPVVESDPRYEQQNIIGRMVEPERIIIFRVPGWMTRAKSRSTGATGSSSTPPSAPTRAACGSARTSTCHHQVPGL